MFSKTLVALSALAVVPQALASLYVTSPVASTTCASGQPCVASWNDDGTTPALGTIGACNVGLFVGNQFTQYKVQDLGAVQLAQQATANWVPNPQAGGNSNLYFLRFTAVNYFPNNDNIPWEGFSAKFTLTGMTGSFNETVASVMSNTGAVSTGAPATSTGSVLATTTGGSSAIVTTTVTKPASASSTGSSKPTSTSSTSVKSAGFTNDVPSRTLALGSIVVSAFIAAAMF